MMNLEQSLLEKGYQRYQVGKYDVHTRPEHLDFFRGMIERENWKDETQNTLAGLKGQGRPGVESFEGIRRFNETRNRRLAHLPERIFAKDFFLFLGPEGPVFVKQHIHPDSQNRRGEFLLELLDAHTWHEKEGALAAEPLGALFSGNNHLLAFRFEPDFAAFGDFARKIHRADQPTAWLDERRKALLRLMGDAIGKQHQAGLTVEDANPERFIVRYDQEDRPVQVKLVDWAPAPKPKTRGKIQIKRDELKTLKRVGGSAANYFDTPLTKEEIRLFWQAYKEGRRKKRERIPPLDGT